MHYDKYFADFTLKKHRVCFDVSEIAVSLPLYPHYSNLYKRSFTYKRGAKSKMIVCVRTAEIILKHRNNGQKGQEKPYTEAGLQNY